MQELFEYTHTTREEDRVIALTEIRNIVSLYSEIKDTAAPMQIQELRDNLEVTKNLLGFDLLSNARSSMELAEIRRKRAWAETFLENVKNVGKDKTFGSKEEAKEQTYLDIERFRMEEWAANKFYYQVKEMVENAEKFINSVASRLRLLQNEK